MESPRSDSPAHFLRTQLLKRTSKNPAYSVRAFARDLKISHSYLSQILNKRRGLSLRQALALSDNLKLEKPDRRAFLELLLKHGRGVAPDAIAAAVKKAPPETTAYMELDQFRMVKDWYHGAIVELTALKDFKSDYGWIAKRLGITTFQAASAVKRLQRVGVLEVSGKKWVKTKRRFMFTTTNLQDAVNGFHQEMIQKALKTLEKKTAEDFAARDITGITIAVDPARIPEAKRRIQKFRNQLADYLTKGEPSEVYQLNVQLFGLTTKAKV